MKPRWDILYHFDKNLQMAHLRLTVTKDTPIPSITPVFLAAFLVENEIQDMFGLHFEGLPINFNRTLYGRGDWEGPYVHLFGDPKTRLTEIDLNIS